MKLPTEDGDQEEVGEFAELLAELWLGNYSIFIMTAQEELRIVPSPPAHLLEKVKWWWTTLSSWLPGICDSCGLWVMVRTESPYGAHPHLCPQCTNLMIVYFEQNGWPDGNWYDGEEGVETEQG
jgi:predicted RNA-binding Zn-ribbon protein involved in translation (DUF1610 family)